MNPKNLEQLERFITRLNQGERFNDIDFDDAEMRSLFLTARNIHGARGYDVARIKAFKKRLETMLRAAPVESTPRPFSFLDRIFGSLSRSFQPRFVPVYAFLLLVVLGGAVAMSTLNPFQPKIGPEFAQMETQEFSQIIADLSSTASLTSDIDLETSFMDIELDDMESVFVREKLVISPLTKEVLELSSSLDEFDPEEIESLEKELDFDLTTI